MTNAPDRSILRCYSIFNIFVFLFGDGPAANQLGKIAVRAAGDYAICSLAIDSGRLSNCPLVALFMSKGWSRFHPSFTP